MTRRILLGLAILVAAGAVRAQYREGQTFTGFRFPEYDEQGVLKTLITGDSARVTAADVFDIRNLRIEMMKDGTVETRVTAARCLFDRTSNEITSDAGVRIVRGDIVITGEGFSWSAAPSRFRIERNARVVLRNVKPDTLRAGETP